MNTALTYIAESVVKAVGVAGIEAMAMKNAIYSVWRPLAEELADTVVTVCFDFVGEDIREEYTDSIYTGFRSRMTTEFIEKVSPYVEEYAGYAWDRGREDAFGYALSGLLPLQKDQESIITDLVSLTGSTKANVQRTIKRWFDETQGQYFDRFIVPETARLLSYEQGASLRVIGERYKEFVKAEGYWSSVSEFNSESSKIFAQVQALHEMNVTTYTVEAVLDKQTCAVCSYLHGSVWSVEEAVTKVYDMLVAEADAAQEMNPFPPRSTPKDFDSPGDSPYGLPPYHPRCRCNIRSTSKVTAMPQEVLARPFDAGPKPTNKLLNKVYDQYVDTPSKARVTRLINAGNIPRASRALTNAEKKVAKKAWESMPFEVKKWASRNKQNFELFIEEGEKVTSRVQGNRIFMNAKFFDPKKYGPQPLQHELRHALVNNSVIDARGGGETIWRELSDAALDKKKGWRPPTHVNAMYQVNGNRGLRAATGASDEFLAMIGDYYKANMSMDELISEVRNAKYGISISDKIGSTVVSSTKRWSAKEAKNAVEYWWYIMDIDNNTLLTKKQMLAKLTYKPSTSQVRAVALNNELNLRDLLRAAGIKEVYQEGDNAPFDVWIGANPAKWYAGTSKKKPWAVIEVKTIVRGKNDKITMHKESLARKRKEHKRFGTRKTSVHTIVFDERTGKIHYRDELGSFRLANMEEVTLDDLQRRFGGKVTGAIREQARIVEAPEYIEDIAQDYVRELADAAEHRKKLKGVDAVPLSKLKNMRPLGDGKSGVNVSYTAEYTLPPKVKGGKRRVKKVLYKPIEGESWIAADIPPSELGLYTRDWYFSFDAQDFKDLVGVAPDEWIRSKINNIDAPLAYREMLAYEISKEIKFKNIKFAKTSIVTENGKPVGVMSEWSNGFVEELQYRTKYASKYKQLTDEERMEMTIFDLLIGNTDRHDRNYMRNLRTGKVMAIDHGYSFPAQGSYQHFDDVYGENYFRFDVDGLNPEWKSNPSRTMQYGFDYVVDEDNYDRILDKLGKLDVQGLGKKYGLHPEEIESLEARRRIVMRLMVDKRIGEFVSNYHATGDWPSHDIFKLDHLFVDLDKNVWEADIP